MIASMPKQYPRDLRERGVGLVAECRGEDETAHALILHAPAIEAAASEGEQP
jgi:hypothetical protein